LGSHWEGERCFRINFGSWTLIIRHFQLSDTKRHIQRQHICLPLVPFVVSNRLPHPTLSDTTRRNPANPCGHGIWQLSFPWSLGLCSPSRPKHALRTQFPQPISRKTRYASPFLRCQRTPLQSVLVPSCCQPLSTNSTTAPVRTHRRENLAQLLSPCQLISRA
jgi:hypothetical protein